MVGLPTRFYYLYILASIGVKGKCEEVWKQTLDEKMAKEVVVRNMLRRFRRLEYVCGRTCLLTQTSSLSVQLFATTYNFGIDLTLQLLAVLFKISQQQVCRLIEGMH